MFGSMINEANEPSSACRLWRTCKVETSTPPNWQEHDRMVSGKVKAREMQNPSSKLQGNS